MAACRRSRSSSIAEKALRPWTPAFTHGDLQASHVFVADDEITGVIDDVLAGYGADVDLEVVHAWWSWRSLVAIRWLVVLRSRM